MGWMHDFLDYMKLDPYFRRDNHHKMTFAMSYNESEKYILVLSHDEVVHLKCSMINKMPGLGIDKFRNLMAGYAFMMGHPGKKLLFMGQEFAQLREWSEERELDWFLLDNPDHKHIQNWVKNCFIFTGRIRRFTSSTAAGAVSSGSMRTMRTEASTVSPQEQGRKKSAALCVQLYTGGKTGLQSGSACQEDLQADIGQ